MSTGACPESVIKRVIEPIMLAPAVFTLHATAATENIALVALAAFSARVSTIQGSCEV